MKLVVKNDLKIEDVKRGRQHNGNKSKYAVLGKMPVGSYIETDPVMHKKIYAAAHARGKVYGLKFKSIIDTNGVSRIFRVA